VIQRWYEFLDGDHDPDRLDALLADDVDFHSPAVFTPQKGRAKTAMYLTAAAKLFGGTDFHYVGQWLGEGSATLELLLIRAARYGVQVSVVPKLRWNRLPDGVIRLAYGHDAHDGEQPHAADGFLLVLATGTDDDTMRLRAGEALSHLLLSATALGLPSCALTEPMTDMRDRMALACELFDAEAYPQALIRLGSAPTDTTQPPVTPRRSVAETTVWTV
jgi:nitroreductase